MANLTSTSDRHDPPPYSVGEYIERYVARLDGRWFSPMRFAGDVKEIRDVRTRRMGDTAGAI